MSLRRPSLGVRLLAAQVLTLATCAVTLSVVAALVGPALFHDHLRRVAGEVRPEVSHHVEQAYASANAVSLGVSLTAGLLVAVLVSVWLAQRFTGPVGALAAAAEELAAGGKPGKVGGWPGREFDTLMTAFNDMADRLAAAEATRRRLLADLGHELRTPVATMEAYFEALEDGVTVPGEDIIDVLRVQTARLRHLAEDIAAVSRVEDHPLDLRLVEVNPAEVVTQAFVAVRPMYQAKGVMLRAETAERVPNVVVDRQRIGQVLGNLLDNALRHTPTSGMVCVSVSASDGWVRIAVRDTGDGIDEAHLAKVFERFYRVDQARDQEHGGSGIGLAIVRALVVAHGGQVSATSAGKGRGTTFTVLLPDQDRETAPN